MAVILWKKIARTSFQKVLENGAVEFGMTTVNKMCNEVDDKIYRLETYPESGTPEPLLRGYRPVIRFCHIMRRFKLIYYYSIDTDIIHILDFWDTRRNPTTLVKRIK